MLGHAIEHAVQRAKIEPSEVDDVIAGCGFGEGATGMNIGRNAALWAGLPASTSGATINRFCASGLQAVASAAGHVASGFADVAIGAGVESISMVQPVVAKTTVPEKRLLKDLPSSMDAHDRDGGHFGEEVRRLREDCDAYALECQKRTAHAQSSGYYDHEIVPMDTIMTVKDKEKGTSEDIKYTVSKDECNRPSTTLESLQGLQPVRGG